jgi:hypothetical protein
MGIWRRIKTAVSNLLHKDRLESDLDAEIREYVDAVADEKIRSGMSPFEARCSTLAEIGGMEQVKQGVRESRAGTSLELLWQDARYGMRMLRCSPLFTWTAVITLGLGIGATTSIFSAVYSLLLPLFHTLIPINSCPSLVKVLNFNRTFLYRPTSLRATRGEILLPTRGILVGKSQSDWFREPGSRRLGRSNGEFSSCAGSISPSRSDLLREGGSARRTSTDHSEQPSLAKAVPS